MTSRSEDLVMFCPTIELWPRVFSLLGNFFSFVKLILRFLFLLKIVILGTGAPGYFCCYEENRDHPDCASYTIEQIVVRIIPH